MPQFGVDGDVVDISLIQVSVSNWDKTIAVIHTPLHLLGSGKRRNAALSPLQHNHFRTLRCCVVSMAKREMPISSPPSSSIKVTGSTGFTM